MYPNCKIERLSLVVVYAQPSTELNINAATNLNILCQASSPLNNRPRQSNRPIVEDEDLPRGDRNSFLFPGTLLMTRSHHVSRLPSPVVKEILPSTRPISSFPGARVVTMQNRKKPSGFDSLHVERPRSLQADQFIRGRSIQTKIKGDCLQ